MRRELAAATTTAEGHSEGLLGPMIEELLQGADVPPREVSGVSDGFLDGKSTLLLLLLLGWYFGERRVYAAPVKSLQLTSSPILPKLLKNQNSNASPKNLLNPLTNVLSAVSPF